MTRQSATKNKPRKQHTPALRDEALKPLNVLAWPQSRANLAVCPLFVGKINGLIRLSAGLEDLGDLQADIRQALAQS